MPSPVLSSIVPEITEGHEGIGVDELKSICSQVCSSRNVTREEVAKRKGSTASSGETTNSPGDSVLNSNGEEIGSGGEENLYSPSGTASSANTALNIEAPSIGSPGLDIDVSSPVDEQMGGDRKLAEEENASDLEKKIEDCVEKGKGELSIASVELLLDDVGLCSGDLEFKGLDGNMAAKEVNLDSLLPNDRKVGEDVNDVLMMGMFDDVGLNIDDSIGVNMLESLGNYSSPLAVEERVEEIQCEGKNRKLTAEEKSAMHRVVEKQKRTAEKLCGVKKELLLLMRAHILHHISMRCAEIEENKKSGERNEMIDRLENVEEPKERGKIRRKSSKGLGDERKADAVALTVDGESAKKVKTLDRPLQQCDDIVSSSAELHSAQGGKCVEHEQSAQSKTGGSASDVTDHLIESLTTADDINEVMCSKELSIEDPAGQFPEDSVVTAALDTLLLPDDHEVDSFLSNVELIPKSEKIASKAELQEREQERMNGQLEAIADGVRFVNNCRGLVDDEATEESEVEEDDGEDDFSKYEGFNELVELEQKWHECRDEVAWRWSWLNNTIEKIEKEIKDQAVVCSGFKDRKRKYAYSNEREGCARSNPHTVVKRDSQSIKRVTGHSSKSCYYERTLKGRVSLLSRHFHSVLSFLEDIPPELILHNVGDCSTGASGKQGTGKISSSCLKKGRGPGLKEKGTGGETKKSNVITLKRRNGDSVYVVSRNGAECRVKEACPESDSSSVITHNSKLTSASCSPQKRRSAPGSLESDKKDRKKKKRTSAPATPMQSLSHREEAPTLLGRKSSYRKAEKVDSTPCGGHAHTPSTTDLLKLKKKKSTNAYDIDNIVIPKSMVATRVEKISVKDIRTPKWRKASHSRLGEMIRRRIVPCG